MKYIADTKAAQSLSAWVILKKGKHVATVRAHFADSGAVSVEIYHTNPDAPGLQRGKASGWGYDKLVAALRGLTVDGVKLYDHAAQSPETAKLLRQFQMALEKSTDEDATFRRYNAKAKKLGASFSNFQEVKGVFMPTSCYMEPGLARLHYLDYQVIQAI